MSIENPVPDYLQGNRPNLSAAKAYDICGRLKRMLKEANVAKYETIHLRLMNTPDAGLKNAVTHTLKYQLDFTNEQTKQWIYEQF